MTACPTDSELRRYVAGEAGADAPRIELHVSDCPPCQAKLERLTDPALQTWPYRDAPAVAADAGVPTIPDLEVVAPAGRGAQGVVYRAVQHPLGRTVALKVLRLADPSPEERTRLQTEAGALARLGHPNVVAVYTTGEYRDRPFVVMEWAAGGSLADRLDGTPWPPAKAAALVATLADAAAAAHAVGVVHRDLKPANVLFAADNAPKLADFGLARLLDAATQTGSLAVVGTPQYMAPEQADGDAKRVGPPADVYALCAILYELLTGRPPFLGDSPFEIVAQSRAGHVVSPRRLRAKLPRDLDTICLHGLHRDPARRYATAAALRDDLRRHLAGESIRARPPGLAERAWKWCRRHPVRAAMIAAGVALVALGVAAERRTATQQARAFVDGILVGDPAGVPDLLKPFERVRPLAADYLAERAAAVAPDSRAALNAAVARLPDDPTQLAILMAWLPHGTPDEVRLIRAAVEPHRDIVMAPLWEAVTDGERPPGPRLRAAAALAGLAADDSRWPTLGPAVADWLVGENPLYGGGWADCFRPVAAYVSPPLATIAVSSARPESQRVVAAAVVAALGVEPPARMAELWLASDPVVAPAFLPALRGQWATAVPQFRAAFVVPPPVEAVTQLALDAHARRRAHAAVGLWHAGDPEPLHALVGETGPDVRARYYAMHRLAPLGVTVKDALDALPKATTAAARRAWLIALGDLPDPGPSRLAKLRPWLVELFRDDPDSGVHSAVEWLVGVRWGHNDWLAAERTALADQPRNGRSWLVTRSGTTMAVLDAPASFAFGAGPGEAHTEGEPRSQRGLTRRVAVATREVTVGEFAAFLAAHPHAEPHYDPPSAAPPAAAEAVRRVRWEHAMQFCRWLSEHDGVTEDQMVYPAVNAIHAGMEFDLAHFDRTGYRLPTEVEWECACRAGTDTPCFFGHDSDLLYRYAWGLANGSDQCHPPGRLRPNDYGLFDILGNVWEWTQPVPGMNAGDLEAGRVTHVAGRWQPRFEGNADPLVARGGSFLYHAPFIRAAKRYWLSPAGDTTIGFRVARTVK